MIRALAVWDVDGTLVDSRAVIYDAAKAAFANLGLPEPTYDAVRQIVGLSLPVALHTLVPQLDEAALAEAVRGYQSAFQQWHRDPAYVEPLYEGAAEALDRLKSHGWRIAMATGKSRRGVEAIIRMHGWTDIFESTHCADDGPGKPHPAMLLAAMRALRCDPGQTVMIGDTSHDMQMARAAGVRAQGVAWGFHTAAEVLAAGADHVAEDFAALNAQLDAFLRAVDLTPALRS